MIRGLEAVLASALLLGLASACASSAATPRRPATAPAAAPRAAAWARRRAPRARRARLGAPGAQGARRLAETRGAAARASQAPRVREHRVAGTVLGRRAGRERHVRGDVRRPRGRRRDAHARRGRPHGGDVRGRRQPEVGQIVWRRRRRRQCQRAGGRRDRPRRAGRPLRPRRRRRPRGGARQRQLPRRARGRRLARVDAARRRRLRPGDVDRLRHRPGGRLRRGGRSHRVGLRRPRLRRPLRRWRRAALVALVFAYGLWELGRSRQSGRDLCHAQHLWRPRSRRRRARGGLASAKLDAQYDLVWERQLAYGDGRATEGSARATRVNADPASAPGGMAASAKASARA
jgi:hypothetical protein